MAIYRIIGKTNSYIANRDAKFRGKTEIVVEDRLSLKEAYSKLLSMYNEMYKDERPYAHNWGLAVIQSQSYAFGAVPTFSDGTRRFEYDGRSYSIEEII